MRSQLSLFPDLAPSPKKDLEVFEGDSAENMHFDLEFEKTLSENVQYHQDLHWLLENGASPSRLGDWAENKVAIIATQLGAEVFQNVSCVGPADLVLRVDDKLFEIDVKMARRRLKSEHSSSVYWSQRNGDTVADGVYGVSFIPAQSGMYCRWFTQNGKQDPTMYPPGLKHFWDPPLKYIYRAANQ